MNQTVKEFDRASLAGMLYTSGIVLVRINPV
jgi:hypothetical protein